MFIRPCYRKIKGKRQAYWALVESYRTERGPRQRTVAWLGKLKDAECAGVKQAAEGGKKSSFAQLQLFDHEDNPEPEWVEVDAARVRVENQLDFGGAWLALELMRRLRLDEFFEKSLPRGKEDIPWAQIATILVTCRLCCPSSELHIAEHYYSSTALPDLLGVPACKINHPRLYRALDQLLPHKEALEAHLKDSLGALFALDYDLLLYDVTSTYFEGLCEGNPQAQRGYSRDKRSDCKQVCIGLVVTREGIPLGYEVFAGNRNDVTTWQEIVTTMERRYGRANRIWCGDRGMMSKANLEFMESGNRRYIIGASKGTLKKFEQHLLGEDWRMIREGLEVKMCLSPDGGRENVHLVPQPRSAGEGKGDARAFRASHRRRAGKGSRELRKSQVEKRSDRPPHRPDHGEELPGRRPLRGGRGRSRRPCGRLLAEERGVAPVGSAQRGLLPSPHECRGLVGRGSLAGVHPVDRRRGGVPNPQERPANSPGLGGGGGGTRPRSGCRPIFWSVSWHTSSGRRCIR